MSENRSKVELLSPAGTYECFIAALLGGADAVYLGLKDFGARKNAGNFSEEELIKALEEAHLRGVKIYLTVNTLFKDNEFENLYNALVNPYINGLDGVIVQDIGVVSFIKNHFPGMEVHASTQMAITDLAGARFAQNIGMERIVPARELTLKEIKRIHDNTDVEIECFVHGAMCYSYSGKCLFSSFLGGRSGNRGLCAQPCRLTYNDTYLLSMKDLCTIDSIPDMIEAGIDSFKIEGRMKSPEYVYNVTSLYRKYIDRYYTEAKYYVEKSDRDKLISLYTRSGNCNGYLYEKNSSNLITFNSPSYSSEKSLNNDEIDEKKLSKIDIDLSVTIKRGEKVKVKGIVHALSQEIEELLVFDDIADEAINSALTVENVVKQFCKTGGTCFNVSTIDVDISDGIFMPNGMLNRIRRDSLEKFKESLLSKYQRSKDNICNRMELSSDSEMDAESDNVKGILSAKISENESEVVIRNETDIDDNKLQQIKVSVLNMSLLKAASENKNITGIIVPLFLMEELLNDDNQDVILYNIVNNNIDIFVSLPYIIRNIEKGISEETLISRIDKYSNILMDRFGITIKDFYVSNYEEVQLLSELYNDYKVIGDIHLYCTNKYAHEFYLENNIISTIVPVELSYRELMERDVYGEEFLIYGRIPMMITSSCVVNSLKNCSYSEKGHVWYINDRKNSKLPVKCICSECTNVIYNSVPSSLATEISKIRKLNPSAYRLDFVDENIDEMQDIIGKCISILNNCSENNEELCSAYTKGHFRKGVL